MSKYIELDEWDLDVEVFKYQYPELSEDEILSMANVWSPSCRWDDCYRIMEGLMKITGGVFLKEDGSATAEINGNQETATGGHCRAICILYLMAKDAENQLQKS